MDLRISYDVFRRRGVRRARIDSDLLLGADAYVALEPAAFVTGLRDWRRKPDTCVAQAAAAIDADWRPL
jgi:hypothetical protein